MRSCLKDQLSLEELRCEFEKFADSKVARELPDFYTACLDREDISDFFERQAVTTAIIDRCVMCMYSVRTRQQRLSGLFFAARLRDNFAHIDYCSSFCRCRY